MLRSGAGERIKLARQQVRGRGVRLLTSAERRPNRALARAESWGAQVCGLAGVPHALATADVVISATSSPSVVLDERTVAEAMHGRPTRPLTLIDLAVPRDIANSAAHIPHVTLLDVDDLQNEVDAALLERQRAIPAVERIIQEELTRYLQRQREAQVRPLITDLRQQAEAIRQQELARTLRHLSLDVSADVDAAVRQQMEFFSQALVKKLFHEPTTRLRTTHTETHIATMRYLFGLEEEVLS
jgi:glutamyl-tRNA reductase